MLVLVRTVVGLAAILGGFFILLVIAKIIAWTIVLMAAIGFFQVLGIIVVLAVVLIGAHYIGSGIVPDPDKKNGYR